jgi:hypothetical protein
MSLRDEFELLYREEVCVCVCVCIYRLLGMDDIYVYIYIYIYIYIHTHTHIHISCIQSALQYCNKHEYIEARIYTCIHI